MLKNFVAYQLSVEFYKASQTLKLPRHLKDQFDRASSSVCLNLAEGSAKISRKDKTKFYNISFGSLRECESIMQLAVNCNDELVKRADRLAAILYRLCYPR